MLRKLSACLNEADMYLYQKDYKNALVKYRQGLNLIRFKENTDEIDFDSLYLNINLSIAIIYNILNLYEDSLWELNEITNNFNSEKSINILKDENFLCRLFLYISKNYCALKNYKQAYIYFRKTECYAKDEEIEHVNLYRNELYPNIKFKE